MIPSRYLSIERHTEMLVERTKHAEVGRMKHVLESHCRPSVRWERKTANLIAHLLGEINSFTGIEDLGS